MLRLKGVDKPTWDWIRFLDMPRPSFMSNPMALRWMYARAVPRTVTLAGGPGLTSSQRYE